MTCSTCDGYEFVPGDGFMLEHCPDCPPKVRCVVHERILTLGGKCPACKREARKAVPLVVLSSLTSDLRDRVVIAAAQPIPKGAVA